MNNLDKRIYLIHGWGGSSEGGWFDWLKEELPKKGFKVIAFDMPNTDEPKIEEWIGYMKENISEKEIDKNTYFIGHSIGCQAIIRFLEKLRGNEKVGGCVFVAPWLDLIGLEPEEIEIVRLWIEKRINFDKVINHCNNFFCIFSDNDPYVSLNEVEKLEKNLRAKIFIKKNAGHFTGEDGTETISEIFEFFKKISLKHELK